MGRYAHDVNMTCKKFQRTFLTSGTIEVFPKEHALLQVACQVAQKQLGPEGAKIHSGNFLNNLALFETNCVTPVKNAVEQFLAEQVAEEDFTAEFEENGKMVKNPKYSPLLDNLKHAPDGQAIFSYVNLLLFACMNNYNDLVARRRAKEEGREMGDGEENYDRAPGPDRGAGHMREPERGPSMQRGHQGDYRGEPRERADYRGGDYNRQGGHFRNDYRGAVHHEEYRGRDNGYGSGRNAGAREYQGGGGGGGGGAYHGGGGRNYHQQDYQRERGGFGAGRGRY